MVVYVDLNIYQTEANAIFNGTKEAYLVHHFMKVIENLDVDAYKGIKG